MKIIPKILLILYLSVSTIYGQTSKWYLQIGGGYLLLDQIEQLGFERQSPSGLLYLEIGKTFQPVSIGIQQSVFQHYRFYRYDIKQQSQSIYAKYSINHLTHLFPYGLDPYVMLGASYLKNRFVTREENDQGVWAPVSQELSQKTSFTFGAGIQIGSQKVILGVHYQYTSGNDHFTVSDFETLPFATGSHLVSLNVGLRFLSPHLNRSRRCPRFGGKGMIRF